MSSLAARFEAPGPDGIGRIVLDRPDDRLNALNPEMIEAIGAAVRQARACSALRGVVVASAKAGQWVAGADLRLLASHTSADEIERTARRFQAVCDELAWLPCTTVAALNGPALGGGLELALACDYRVAGDAPELVVGQPEVNLGLLPAGGGTQRLPRLIGLEPALDLILSGRRLNARRARRAGIIDEVVHPLVLDTAASRWAAKPKRPLDRPLRLGPNRRSALELAELTPVGRAAIYRRARAGVLERTRGHYPAPLRALEAVRAGLEHGMAAGLDAEARAFGELADSPAARNLIWLFMATQRQKRRFETDRARTVERVGVVGAGFMGAAIAEVAAVAGLPVRLRDTSPENVAAGLARVRRMADNVGRRRGLRPAEAQAIAQRVAGTTDYTGFHAAQVVIEAVFEDLSTKQTVVRELENVLSAETVIATNTSALPIARIASAASRPERIVGMHFFSPAERMPLLEVIRPAAAADWAVATAVSLGVRLGKTVIVVGDSPGFYTSRVLGVMLNEAALLLTEGASIDAVDAAATAFGFPVGPFVLYDEVGLAVAQHAGETVSAAFGARIPPAEIVGRLVATGAVGKRVGAGFYMWRKPGRLLGRRSERRPNPRVYELLGRPARRDVSVQHIQDRLALLFVNEAMRCLEEGVLASPADGDLGAVLGLGFPPFLGGPFHYADAIGPEHLERRLRRLAEAHGERYAPADVLVETARQARTFHAEQR